jgi:hypothetical protein
METAPKSLKLLELSGEAHTLEQQKQKAILQVEKRQQYQQLTLDQSDDYPRQPDPSESTPVRQLRDAWIGIKPSAGCRNCCVPRRSCVPRNGRFCNRSWRA